MAGRIRSIKPELLEDEAAAGLSDIAWRIWVSTFLLADDYGNYRANARWIRSQVLWARPDASDADVENAIIELSSCKGDGGGLIQLYTVRGQSYAHITGWSHQKVDKPGKPRCPGPDEVDSEVPREDSREVSPPRVEPRELSRLTGTGTGTSDQDQERDRPAAPLWKDGLPIASVADLEVAVSDWRWSAIGVSSDLRARANRLIVVSPIEPHEYRDARPKAEQKRQKGTDRLSYLLGTVEGKRNDAAAEALRPPAPGARAPNADTPAYWRDYKPENP